MKVVLQRVSRASVVVGGELVASIGPGFLALVGVGHGDEEPTARRLAGRVATLRVFGDDHGKMDRSVRDAGGEVLVVSQFTLYADLRKGRRPSWAGAAEPAHAETLVAAFADALEAEEIPVERGVFGADMQVELVNDGPVTILLDTAKA
jgi:D-aminoacyl-tRNA deacylase